MKKIFSLIVLFSSFFIFSTQVKAEALCCPSGYTDGPLSCSFDVDTNFQCCHRNGFGDYTVVNKIPCSDDDADSIHVGDPVTSETLNKLNPLIQEGDEELALELSTPGGIISRFLGVFAFPIAGLVLFVMLIWGGVEMMAGSATSKSVDAGKQRITTALIGFFLLFASYWIARILELMFGIKIL